MNRPARVAAIREALAAGRPSVGSWIQLPHASVAEIMGQAGYDWVAVDLEHGSIAVDQLPDLFRALELGDTLPLARLASGGATDCKQALDAGAGGVIIPMVETPEQLAAAIDACRWPPAGARGVGFSRANLYGRHFEAYAREAQAPLVVAMIEHARALTHLESIIGVPGLDAILIGPYDLSASMGTPGLFEAPAFRAALDRILATCLRLGMPCGVHVVHPEPAVLEQRVAEGYRFLAYSVDAVFLTSAAGRPPLAAPPILPRRP
jgi:2-dehydro-3-deoxyglucarate aldolase